MSATNEDAINVTVTADQGAISRKEFGTPLFATDDLGAGFTERLRIYESPTDIKADTDVNPATRDFIVNFGFAQRANGGVSKIAVGRVDYLATLSDELQALVDAEVDEGIQWYGLALSSVVQADIQDIAAAIGAYDKLFLPITADAAVLAGTAGNVAEVLAGFLYSRVALLYHLTGATERADLAWLAKKLGKDPDTGKTSWRHATLEGIAADVITSTEKATVQGDNANLYLPFKGVNTTSKGVLASGNPIDTRISRDWFKARAEERLASLIVQISNRNQDLPYDQDGIDVVFGEVRTLIDLAESLRHFQVGSGQLEHPRITDIDAATRASRKLTLTGSAILAGSIEEIDLIFAVEF